MFVLWQAKAAIAGWGKAQPGSRCPSSSPTDTSELPEGPGARSGAAASNPAASHNLSSCSDSLALCFAGSVSPKH